MLETFPKSNFTDTSQGLTLQSGLSKNRSFEPAMLTLFCIVFSFLHFKILFCWLLACIPSEKKSVMILIFVPLYVTVPFFPLAAFMTFLGHSFQQFVYDVSYVCGWMCIRVYFAWDSLNFLELWVCSFQQIEIFSAIIFSVAPPLCFHIQLNIC